MVVCSGAFRACSTADCHAHPASVTVLGVLDIAYSLDAFDAGRRSDILTVVGILLLVGGQYGTFVAETRIPSGLAALIATHNLELAEQMDRRVTLRDGRIEDLP